MAFLGVVLVVLFGAVLRGAPDPVPLPHGPAPRFVVLDQHVKNVLAADWDAHARDPAILERAYCLTYQKDVWVVPGEFVYRVTEIAPADSVEGAEPHRIAHFSCPTGPGQTIAHVHPNQSCISATECVPGGWLGGQCYPSDVDRAVLQRMGSPFALIVCSRDVVAPCFRTAPSS